MKKLVLGAGALLLSTSPLVGIGHASTSTAAAINGEGLAWAMSPMLREAGVDAGMTQVQAVDWAGNGQTAALAGGKNSQPTASQIAEKQLWLAQQAGSSTEMAMKDGAGVKTAGMSDSVNGQGGPDESAESTGGVWPACRPGPGDDRCIQLYERGVRGAFAQWSAGRERLGMGGPEEPVTGKQNAVSADRGMTSDMSAPGKADTGMGPTTEPTGVRAVGKTATSMNAGQQSTGMATATQDGMAAGADIQTDSGSGAKETGY